MYFFGYKTNETRDEEHWGSLPTAMLTLFGFVTVSYPQIHYLVKFCFRSQHKKCLMKSVDEKGMLFWETDSLLTSRILDGQSASDPGFGQGGPQLLRPKVADVAKWSGASEGPGPT